MFKRTVSVMIQILLFIGMLALAFNIQLVKASTVYIYIRADGSIDPPTANITSMDNVTYYFTDNNINARIFVQRSNITIDGNGYTLQGGETHLGFSIWEINNVTIKNTYISNFTVGIMLVFSNNCIVNGNCITNCLWEGMYMEGSNCTSVTSNTISHNHGHGIIIDDSIGNTISGNILLHNNGTGIHMSDSPSNTITNNTINNHRNGIWLNNYSFNNSICDNNASKNQEYGIFIDEESNYTTIIGNYVGDNGYGILLNGSDYNTLSYNFLENNAAYGADLYYLSEYNDVANNNVANNSIGVYLHYISDNNNVANNNVANNSIGVIIELSEKNTLKGNNITDNNMYGIKIMGQWSRNNKIYHNNFINNTAQTYTWEAGKNVWDDGYPSGGNYWSDYTDVDLKKGPDQNINGSDGIGDTPHAIDALNIDDYPLMPPFPVHDLGIIEVKKIPVFATKKTVVGLGYNLNISVKIVNYGINTEAFNATAYANARIIEKINVTLASRSSTTITFTWNTTGFAKGNYTIMVCAEPVIGETDTTDNMYVDGWVIVAMVGDITGPAGWPDGKCDMRDIRGVAKLFEVSYPDPKYNCNCDVTGPTPGVADGKIDMRDIRTVAKQFGKTDP